MTEPITFMINQSLCKPETMAKEKPGDNVKPKAPRGQSLPESLGK